MKQFISLLKINLNVNFGLSALRYRFTKEKKRMWEPVLIGLSIVLGGGSIVALYTMFLLGVYMGGTAINSPELVLILALFVGQFIVFVFGIFYIMSTFYFSDDMDILVPLPLKPYQVLASKFIVIVINEYLVMLPMLLPSIIIYGTGMRSGTLYWFKSIFILLLSPIIPLVIASLFVLILMRFVNIRKSKDLIVVMGSLLGLFMGLAINYFTQRIPENNPEEFIQDLIASQAGIIEVIGRRFPPSLWATYGLARPGLDGWAYFLLYCLVSAFLFIFLLWLGNLIFYRGLLSGQEVNRKKKHLSAGEISAKAQKVSNPVTALFWREWKLFLRTPIYAMNGLAGMIMVPFLVFMPLIAQDGEIHKILSKASQPEFLMPATLGGLGLLLFTSSINIVSCTSISREGKTFWISKIIPVSPRQQVTAKLLHGMAISCLGIVVTIIVLAIALKLPPLRLLIMLVLGLLGTFLLNVLNLTIDVLRPKLEWNDPQEAVKQNLNGFFSIVLTFAALILFGALTISLVKIGVPEWWIYIILGLTMVILIAPSMAILYTLAETQYKKIET